MRHSLLSTAYAQSTTVVAEMSGAAQVDSDGDLDGTGTATVQIDAAAGEACFTFEYANLDTPIAAHIHAGDKASNGDVVLDFDWASTNGSGCVAASTATLSAIQQSPDQYYVNIHTTAFPPGAIRGQLATTSGAPQELAFTGSTLTSILGVAGITLLGTGALLVRAANKED